MRSEMIVHPDEVSKQWIDRLADGGITVLGIHPTGGKNASESLAAMVELLKTPEYRARIDYARTRGLEVEYEIHAAGYLMPKNLFAEHPEYFRMNEDGVRVCDWNFCVSNHEALELFSDRAAELAISLYGSSSDFYFWMDDGGHHTRCHCPACRRFSASDQQLIAVNAMLQKIRKKIPQARMAYLAYQATILPPSCVSPAEGVFLEYAPFEKYTAKGEDAAALIRREQEMILPLMSFFGRNSAKVLEYWYDNSLYSRWKKPPARFTLDAEAMKKDLALYRALGFQSVATFACFLGEDYEALHGAVEIGLYSEAIR